MHNGWKNKDKWGKLGGEKGTTAGTVVFLGWKGGQRKYKAGSKKLTRVKHKAERGQVAKVEEPIQQETSGPGDLGEKKTGQQSSNLRTSTRKRGAAKTKGAQTGTGHRGTRTHERRTTRHVRKHGGQVDKRKNSLR